MSPWIFLTGPLGFAIIAFVVYCFKEIYWPKKVAKHTTLTDEVQKKIDDQFLPISVKEVFALHRTDLDLYIRTETEEERAIRKCGG